MIEPYILLGLGKVGEFSYSYYKDGVEITLSGDTNNTACKVVTPYFIYGYNLNRSIPHVVPATLMDVINSLSPYDLALSKRLVGELKRYLE